MTFVSEGHFPHGHLSPMHFVSQHLSLQHIERITAAFIAWQQPDKLRRQTVSKARGMFFIVEKLQHSEELRKVGEMGIVSASNLLTGRDMDDLRFASEAW
ncbi:MAG: hypothetical protein KGQ89_11295 [Verrucomicrobia bacterium]|nr:hypothetical protein [Verrucomicrobiota bacterium]